jgi:hypothetical protein
VEKFKYLSMTVTNQNLTEEEIKSRSAKIDCASHGQQQFTPSYQSQSQWALKHYRDLPLLGAVTKEQEK